MAQLPSYCEHYTQVTARLICSSMFYALPVGTLLCEWFHRPNNARQRSIQKTKHKKYINVLFFLLKTKLFFNFLFIFSKVIFLLLISESEFSFLFFSSSVSIFVVSFVSSFFLRKKENFDGKNGERTPLGRWHPLTISFL